MDKDKSVSGLELWQWRQKALASANLADVPHFEVDWILQEIAGLDRLALRLESFKSWPKIVLKLSLSELERLWEKRLRDRLPVQYITGVTHWRNLALKVSPSVLIPRPETEILIDLAVKAISPTPPRHWVDLGTGSGAIAIALADAFPNAIIHAVDKSADALSIARENAQILGFPDKIKFYQGSWFEPLGSLKGKLGGMVSNPPYIPSQIVPTLQPEVAQHEPHLALDGGSDGLDYIRHLIEVAPEYLLPGGIWLIEMMAGQAKEVVELLQCQGNYREIQIFSDLAGIERFAFAYCC